MIWTLLAISILLAILFYWLWHLRIGHVIGSHLALFEAGYDDLFQKTGSPEHALRHALFVFRDCPRLNKLDAQDIERFVTVIGTLENPKRVVVELVMRLHSSRIVDAFRNEQLLNNIVELEQRRPRASEDPGVKKRDALKTRLHHLVDKAGDLLERYLKTDDQITRKSGTFRSLVRHVPFDELLEESRSLLPSFSGFVAEVRNFRGEHQEVLSREQEALLDALESHANALLDTANRLVDRQQAAFEASVARSKLTWNEYQKLQAAYELSIERYVRTGTAVQEHVDHVLV